MNRSTFFKSFVYTPLLVLFTISYAKSTITINSYPPPYTAQCTGGDIDLAGMEAWKDAYVNTNPATTDCADGSSLTWYLDDHRLFPFYECSDFEVTFEVYDECGDSEYFDVTISFSDDEPPYLRSHVDLNQTFYCNDINELRNEIDDITYHGDGFADNCTFDHHDITVTNDYCYGSCDFDCPETFVVNFTAEDNCNNIATYAITFNLISNLDPDNDGIDNPVDNCPNHYNPGQEDIDSDGIGNPCDSSNEVGEIAEIQSNLYLSAPYTGLIMRSENGSCYILTVNNDGTLSTLPADCP